MNQGKKTETAATGEFQYAESWFHSTKPGKRLFQGAGSAA